MGRLRYVFEWRKGLLMTNLVKLYTCYGPMFIDTKELARRRTHLTIYTQKGNKVRITGRTKEIREQANYGVHFDNLYASQELAEAATARIYGELEGAARGMDHHGALQTSAMY